MMVAAAAMVEVVAATLDSAVVSEHAVPSPAARMAVAAAVAEPLEHPPAGAEEDTVGVAEEEDPNTLSE